MEHASAICVPGGYSCATPSVSPGTPIVPALPVTGGAELVCLLVGLALVAAGAALLIWVRRHPLR